MEIQDGTYRAKARSWSLAESSKGTPEVAVEFAFQVDEAQTASLTWHGYLSDKAYVRTIESLRICGWKGDDLSDLTGLDSDEVDIVVEHEEYESEGEVKVFAKVKWVNKPGGLAVKAPMSADKAKAFAAAMKSKIRALDAANGKKSPAPKTNGSKAAADRPLSDREVGDDSDIPF